MNETSKAWHYFLRCPVMNYEWGSTRANGIIARFLQKKGEMDPHLPLAEFWMGAHPIAPSQLISSGEDLNTAIERDPEFFLGKLLLSRGISALPFLFKILEIEFPLSIQAHPNKAQARSLHKLHPDIYTDENAKPEMAISINGLRALVGFRPYADILRSLELFPELSSLCCENINGTENIDDANENASMQANQISSQDSPVNAARLKKMYTNLLSSDPAKREFASRSLLARGDAEPSRELKLFCFLYDSPSCSSPSDVGPYHAFFLNELRLSPGQVIYLQPGTPHAYLEGSILECMASSDNVVRAGLTSKYVDTDALIDILNFSPSPMLIQEGIQTKPGLMQYGNEYDFELQRLETGTASEDLSSPDLPSILLIQDKPLTLFYGSESVILQAGDVVFLPGSLGEKDCRLRLRGGPAFRAMPGPRCGQN